MIDQAAPQLFLAPAYCLGDAISGEYVRLERWPHCQLGARLRNVSPVAQRLLHLFDYHGAERSMLLRRNDASSRAESKRSYPLRRTSL